MPSEKGYNQLMKDEGFTPSASYLKTQGGGREKVRTVGYGYNIDAADDPVADLLDAGVDERVVDDVLLGKKPITEEQGKSLFDISVRRASSAAARVIPNFDTLDKTVQDVLINMSYQLGPTGLSEFKNLKRALMEGNYGKAAKEILDSDFARNDATNRATRLSKSILDYNDEVQKNTPPPSPKKTASQIYQDTKRQSLAKDLASLYSRSSLVDDLASKVATMTPKGEPEGDIEKQKEGEVNDG